ncbi:MAG TPA: TolC family protein [Pyrinomonadaceae bacterium]|jgi:HAE1 family hydrophobic/amphiphilic exporter-1
MKRVVISTFFAIFLTALTAAAQTTPQATPPVTTQPNPSQQQQQTEIQQQNQQPVQQQQQQNQTTNPAQQQTLPSQNPTTTTPGVTPSGQIANPNTVIQQTPTQNVGTTNTVAPADLPNEPPPVAPNFEAQTRPLPSAERVGVDIANQLPMTLEEAIEMALQNNNDIDTSKIDVQIAEFNLRGARGVYDPQIASESYYESATTPVASTIGGATGDSVTQTRYFGSAGVSGFSPWQGGSYAVDFNSSRTTTSNTNATLNPQFPSALTFSYRQPIFRGRRFDNNRRQIEIAKKNLSLTDAQFRQRAIEVITQVEQAYWDLVFSLRNLQVQIDAVKQARTQLESNQRLVSKGVLAPIDVVAATTQITTFEQSVYTAQEDVTRAENTLKMLMLPDRTSEIWSRPITPISEISLEPPRAPLEVAISDALKNRPEITQLATTAEINQIDQRYYRDQTKPQVDLVGSYTSQGLAGTPNPARTVPPNLVGGYINSLGNLIGQDYPTYRVGVSIALPWGNRTAKANYGRSLAEANQIVNNREKQEQIIEAEVRNSLQALRSAEARLASALAARASAEQLYESEQRQFRAGITTFYLVLQRQTELLTARGRELQAQTDLNKAISEFQRATGTTLSANNVSVSGGGTLQIITGRRNTLSTKLFEK